MLKVIFLIVKQKIIILLHNMMNCKKLLMRIQVFYIFKYMTIVIFIIKISIESEIKYILRIDNRNNK